jgi:CRISPR-associated protein Csb3
VPCWKKYRVLALFQPTTAYPAVELLCLVGLQVARPAFTEQSRIYDYFLWPVPLLPNLLLAAASGTLELPGQQGFRFENWFRTGQRKHKAFRSATPLRPSEADK